MCRKSKDNNDDVKLTFGEKITDVACGALHSLLLTNKGRVFASGFNETYALGNGNTENQCTFSEVPFFSSGQAYDRNITKLAAGVSHSACIIQDTAYVWGVWGTQPNMINQTPAAVQMSSIQGNSKFSRFRESSYL